MQSRSGYEDSMGEQRPTPRPDLRTLEGYHSPQIEVEVRLNTNESPLPPPSGFVEALTDGIRDLPLNRYPDRSAFRLRERLAERCGLEVGQVFAANGSNEVIQSILLAYGGPDRSVAVFEPTYGMHAQIARTTGTRVVSGRRNDRFLLDPGQVTSLVEAEHPEVLFLCSPNNPTGTLDPEGLVDIAVEAVGDYGGLVVVDEAYGEFASTSALDRIGEDRSLLVIRTFSKTWAMAGIRLGYLLGPSWCVAELEKVALPYHLGAVTQLAGLVALDHEAEMSDRVALLVAERERLSSCLEELDVTVWPSAANFVLFRPEAEPGDRVWSGLLDRSVLLRDCSTWDGLNGCLRVTIGTQEENDRFLVALREVLA